MLFLPVRQVLRVVEEEWSYIPVGGPLPLPGQNIAAFGAAANLVHPATGHPLAPSPRPATTIFAHPLLPVLPARAFLPGWAALAAV